MSMRMGDVVSGALSSLCYEPTEKRLRVYLGDAPVADTKRGLLIWEPGRVVPTYAVPVSDVVAQLEPAGVVTDSSGHAVLDPRKPFTAHTCAGASFDVVVGDKRREAAAFRPADRDLAEYLTFDFNAFRWHEEDEPIVAHPHDPFRRIDTLHSSRHVRIEWEGWLLAESSEPVLLFETLLPVRFYLPETDVVADLKQTDTVTYCAYKGRASYFSVPDGPSDVAWTYPEPLHDAEPVRDLIAFFDERVDVIVDGERRQRPVTHFSR